MRKILAATLFLVLPSCEGEDFLDGETTGETISYEVPQSEILGTLPPVSPSKEIITCIVNSSKVPGGEDVCNYKCPDKSFGLCWRNPAGSWDCSECRGRAHCESWTSTSEKCPYL